MPQKIAVIGGGVAGCEAARVLKLRGHEPEIFEKSSRLGGKLHQAGAPDFKRDDKRLIGWYEHQMKKLEIPVHFDVTIRGEETLSAFDKVIVATGSEPVWISLGQEIPVVFAGDVMEHPEKYQAPFAVVGGGLVGCELALMLAEKGKQVCIVEAMPELMAANGPSCYANRQMLTDLIRFHKIPIYKNSKAWQTDEEGLLIQSAKGTEHVPAGTVVLSVGYRADQELAGKLWEAGKEVYVIGEAKDGSGNILRSIWDAYEIASGM